VTIRINQVTRELNSSSENASSDTDDVDLGELTNAINEFTNSIMEVLNPLLAIGWNITLITSVASIGIILMSMNRENSPHSTSLDV
jgi:hypothetical protein